MKKINWFEITKTILAAFGTLFIIIILAGIYKFNFTNNDIFFETESGEVVSYDEYNERVKENIKTGEEKDIDYDKEIYDEKGIHKSWDIDGDGINDCELDGSCDHTVDYSKLRNI